MVKTDFGYEQIFPNCQKDFSIFLDLIMFSSCVQGLNDAMIIGMSITIAILHVGINIREYVMVSMYL
jgi:hypothetical protein